MAIDSALSHSVAAGEPVTHPLTLSGVGTVAATGLPTNAFLFGERHYPACIGVTEGALSRLSRPQLQTVVAHRVAQVASRDCVTATRACLLFLGVVRTREAVGRWSVFG